MTTYYNNQEPGYTARQEREKKERMILVKQEALQCYQTMMNAHCGGPNTVPQFDDVHTKAELKALDVLNTAAQKYDLHEYTEFFADINKVGLITIKIINKLNYFLITVAYNRISKPILKALI
jgi:hypothetical protein